jgi:hypothetical protein
MVNSLIRNPKFLSTTAEATTIANGIKMEIMPTWPIQVLKWGGVVTTAITTNPLQVRCNFRPTAGSATGEVQGATASGVDTAGGQISLSTALGVAGRAFEHVVSQAPISASSFGGVTSGLVVLPGQSVTLEAFGTAPGAGAVAYSLEYVELPVPGGVSATATVSGGSRGTLIKL